MWNESGKEAAETGRSRPGANRHLHKWRDRRRADPFSFTHQVDEHPAAVALLHVPRLERRELPAAQGAAEKHRQNGAVPFSFHGFAVWLSEQIARLFPAEPVPCPVAGLMDALEGHDSLGHAAIEQSFSAGSTAILRIADSCRLMEGGAKLADSRMLRYC